MNRTSEIIVCFVISVAVIFPLPSKAACCFGSLKTCENLSDVATYGQDDWKTLVISPGRCENTSEPSYSEIISENTFAKIPQITNLYIVTKQIQFTENCFKPMKDNLVYLSIIKNNISVIPTGVFQDLPKVKKLVLRDSGINEIASDAFKNLPKLEVLLLSGNNMREIKSGILDNFEVKTIDLSYNSIREIEQNVFANNVILLNLKKNELEEIKDNTFSNLSSLEMLILSKNKIKTLRKGTFAGLSNLSKLDLSRNQINSIETDTFSDLHELMFLYLKSNRLHVFNADIFLKDMINLTDLELEQNNLSYLSNDVFKRMPNLEEISLSGNPWSCKCLDEIYEILNNRSIVIANTDEELRPKCIKSQNACVSVM